MNGRSFFKVKVVFKYQIFKENVNLNKQRVYRNKLIQNSFTSAEQRENKQTKQTVALSFTSTSRLQKLIIVLSIQGMACNDN